jgi:ubiquinone/menaquinone biosynthesis C-methylase UbiE
MMDDKVHAMMKAENTNLTIGTVISAGAAATSSSRTTVTAIAKALIDIYGLKNGSKVLDVGCGKAFLL